LAKRFDASLSSRDEVLPNADTSRMFEISSPRYKMIIVGEADIQCPPDGRRRLTFNAHFYRVDILANDDGVGRRGLAGASGDVSNMIVAHGGRLLSSMPSCTGFAKPAAK